MNRRFVLGVATGICGAVAALVACGQAASRAKAAPADCAMWQFSVLPSADPGYYQTDPAGTGLFALKDGSPSAAKAASLPAGWEPFAMPTTGGVAIRRCKP